MTAKILPKHALHEWVETLREHYRVIGPKPAQSQYIFGDIHSVDDLDLSYPTSILPPKKVLLPQREDLFHFDAKGEVPIVEPTFDDEPTVTWIGSSRKARPISITKPVVRTQLW
jgi:hypothetical protein